MNEEKSKEWLTIEYERALHELEIARKENKDLKEIIVKLVVKLLK